MRENESEKTRDKKKRAKKNTADLKKIKNCACDVSWLTALTRRTCGTRLSVAVLSSRLAKVGPCWGAKWTNLRSKNCTNLLRCVSSTLASKAPWSACHSRAAASASGGWPHTACDAGHGVRRGGDSDADG